MFNPASIRHNYDKEGVALKTIRRQLKIIDDQELGKNKRIMFHSSSKSSIFLDTV